VDQLKGKRIELPKGTITEFIFLSKIAPAHGLKAGDYQVANIPDAKDRVPSMVARAVDMTALGDPFVAIAEQEGVIRTLEDFCKYDVLPFMMTATTKVVRENPDAVVAYLRGWLRAVTLLKDEPEKAAAVYLDDLKSQGREVALPVLDKALRRMRWEPEITPAIDKYLVDMAKDMTVATSGQRLKAVPDLAKGVNKELMKKAMAGR
jgi:ABC-type nitrate/sulfonate/bicarbonate transport system substrate-binding protein